MTTTAATAGTVAVGAGLAAVASITDNPFAELGVIGALVALLFFMVRQRFTDNSQATKEIVKAIESLEVTVRKTRKDAGRTQLMMISCVSRALEIVEKNNGEHGDVAAALESTRAALTQLVDAVKDSSGYTETHRER